MLRLADGTTLDQISAAGVTASRRVVNRVAVCVPMPAQACTRISRVAPKVASAQPHRELSHLALHSPFSSYSYYFLILYIYLCIPVQ
jgi:hypothetical protein